MLLVLLLGFIWGHSLQNGTASQAESQLVLHIVPPGSVGEPARNGLAELLYHPETGPSHGICGPGDGPFRVGALWKTELFLVLCWGVCVGAVDEGIQIFSPGRSAQVSDVVLDTCGVLAGALVLRLVCWLVRGERTKERSRR